ncbi:MAG: peptide deformylase [Candidatus Wallbacteria bacterium]|nr:peptide deformylase [Candidatus Wallbacteria bacterium]
MEIKVYGNPTLRLKAQLVEVNSETVKLAEEMVGMMYTSNGVGLAAPQVGVSARIIVLDPQLKTGPLILFNPEIYWADNDIEACEEGCLSFPGMTLEIDRPSSIRYCYLDKEGKRRERDASGYEARIVQHELDHLEGVLIVDHVSQAKRLLLKRKLSEIKKTGKEQE